MSIPGNRKTDNMNEEEMDNEEISLDDPLEKDEKESKKPIDIKAESTRPKGKDFQPGTISEGDLDATRNGFYPGFDLLIFKNIMVEKLPIYNWIIYADMQKAKEPGPLQKRNSQPVNLN